MPPVYAKRYPVARSAASRFRSFKLKNVMVRPSVTRAAQKIQNVGGAVIPRRSYNRNGELKYVDIASTVYACDTTGSVTALNLTAVGDDNTTRDGRQIIVTSCHIRGLITNQDASTATSLARWLLVWDKQPNGAIATIANILAAATSISSTNLNNRERFVILRDKQYGVGQIDTTATQTYTIAPGVHECNEYVKINARTTYGGTAADIASVATGALLLVTIGNQAAASGAQLTAATRVRFTDS